MAGTVQYAKRITTTQNTRDDMSDLIELSPNDPRATVCGNCGRGWDDSISTSGTGYFTPVPSGRCPFEYEHNVEDGI